MRDGNRFLPVTAVTVFNKLAFHSLAWQRTAMLCLAVSVSFGCNNAFFERGTQIKIINSEAPLSFKLQGSGDVLRLFFYGPYTSINVEEIGAKLNDPPVWEISPPPKVSISELPIINYGKLPPHFTQNTPITGTPPQLMDGKCYRVIAPTNGANEGSVCFCIKDGKAVEVESP